MNIGKVLSGISLLILVFLVVSNADATVKIINGIASNSLKGIQVLQGRSYLIAS